MPVFDMTARNVDEVAAEIRGGTHGDLTALTNLAMEFRRQADAGEHNFIRFLRAFEISEVWSQVDAGTFESFLKRNHICAPERYRGGVRTLNLIPTQDISAISFAAAREVAKIADQPRRDEALQRVRSWAEAEGRPPSPEKARELAGIQNPQQLTPQQRRRQELEEENASLRQEVDRLRALVVSLGGDPDVRETAA